MDLSKAHILPTLEERKAQEERSRDLASRPHKDPWDRIPCQGQGCKKTFVSGDFGNQDYEWKKLCWIDGVLYCISCAKNVIAGMIAYGSKIGDKDIAGKYSYYAWKIENLNAETEHIQEAVKKKEYLDSITPAVDDEIDVMDADKAKRILKDPGGAMDRGLSRQIKDNLRKFPVKGPKKIIIAQR